ncbi:MAG: iron-sulfur cluster assembly accessory protein [Rhodospirillales bacterium]|nr:iron-sulfur cluster assembly accessory protein [Rhodospirillales bacterium]MDE0712101.1 iron-sulfur cluster assembly accessory protein [Rhodospirillales bacterium]
MDTSVEAPIRLTERARQRLSFILSQPELAAKFVRIAIQGGGCSGFSYDFSLDDALDGQDDVVISQRPDGTGAGLVIDSMSMIYVAGSEIDWVESPGGAMFNIENPNATASCGCGTSFAID